MYDVFVPYPPPTDDAEKDPLDPLLYEVDGFTTTGCGYIFAVIGLTPGLTLFTIS